MLTVRLLQLAVLVTAGIALAQLPLAPRVEQSERAHSHSLETILNARDYGAKGDGRTDDTNAIRAALAAAAGRANAVLYLPAGTYLHSGLNLTESRFVLRGDGSSRTIIRLQPHTNRPSVVAGTALEYLTIQDLTIDGSEALQDSAAGPTYDASGIYVSRAQHVRIERVEVIHTYSSGITVSQSTDVTIQGCVLRQNGRRSVNANGIAVLTPVAVSSADSASNIQIVGNVVETNTGSGDGIFVSSDVVAGVPQFNYREVFIGHNTIRDAFDEGIEVKGVRHFSIVGNRVFGSGRTTDGRNRADGILARESSDGVIASNDVSGFHSGIAVYTGTLANVGNIYVVHNTVRETGKGSAVDARGIKILAERGFSIADVVVADNRVGIDSTGAVRPKAGIGVIGAGSIRHLTLVGNDVSLAHFAGLYVERITGGNVSNLTVSRNRITDNGDLHDHWGAASAIQIDGGHHLLIEGNICSETRMGAARTQHFGLVLSTAVRDVTVSANECTGNLTRGIWQSGDSMGEARRRY